MHEPGCAAYERKLVLVRPGWLHAAAGALTRALADAGVLIDVIRGQANQGNATDCWEGNP